MTTAALAPSPPRARPCGSRNSRAARGARAVVPVPSLPPPRPLPAWLADPLAVAQVVDARRASALGHGWAQVVVLAQVCGVLAGCVDDREAADLVRTVTRLTSRLMNVLPGVVAPDSHLAELPLRHVPAAAWLPTGQPWREEWQHCGNALVAAVLSGPTMPAHRLEARVRRVASVAAMFRRSWEQTRGTFPTTPPPYATQPNRRDA